MREGDLEFGMWILEVQRTHKKVQYLEIIFENRCDFGLDISPNSILSTLFYPVVNTEKY